jgi:hypothetical protein
MRKVRFVAALVAALFGAYAGKLAAEDLRMIELATPRPAGPGEAVELQVANARLPRGARLRVMTEDGNVLGAVTPYGEEFSRTPSSATIPIPRSAITDGRVRLRLEVIEPGAPSRPPRPDEVDARDLKLSVVPRS